MPIVTPLIDWHSVLFRKTGTDAALLLADGTAGVAISGAGTAMKGLSLIVGDASNSTSAEADIAKLIICDAGALTAAQRMAVQTWIRG